MIAPPGPPLWLGRVPCEPDLSRFRASYSYCTGVCVNDSLAPASRLLYHGTHRLNCLSSFELAIFPARVSGAQALVSSSCVCLHYRTAMLTSNFTMALHGSCVKDSQAYGAPVSKQARILNIIRVGGGGGIVIDSDMQQQKYHHDRLCYSKARVLKCNVFTRPCNFKVGPPPPFV